MAKLKVQNIRKSYANLEVIHGLNLEIEDGSFVVLLGPSGCGKSTLLRMIAGLESITSGEVIIGDEVVNKIHPKDRNIAMVFQNYALYANMTVFDNIAFSLKLRKMSAQKIREKVDWAASILNLQDFLMRYPRQLSGGQRQRIGIARALAVEPEFIVADEPISALDVSIQAQVVNLLKDLQDELKLTYLFIAHDLSMIRYICDRVAVMFKGKIVEYAETEELYENPVHPYTKVLLSAVPIPDPDVEANRVREIMQEDFDYTEADSSMTEVSPGHFVATSRL